MTLEHKCAGYGDHTYWVPGFGSLFLVEPWGLQLKDFPRPQEFSGRHFHLLVTHLFPLYVPTHGAKGGGSLEESPCDRPCDGHGLTQINDLFETRFTTKNISPCCRPQEIAKSPRPLPACIIRRFEWTLHLLPLPRSLLPSYSSCLHQSP